MLIHQTLCIHVYSLTVRTVYKKVGYTITNTCKKMVMSLAV